MSKTIVKKHFTFKAIDEIYDDNEYYLNCDNYMYYTFEIATEKPRLNVSRFNVDLLLSKKSHGTDFPPPCLCILNLNIKSIS